MTSNFIETSSGRRLHYLQAGASTGPLIICLHGLGGSANTFKPLLPKLPSAYKIILLDFPGFGESPPLVQPPTVSSYVSDLHDVVTSLEAGSDDKEGTKKVILVGHSLGTTIALHFAAQYPTITAGLGLICAARSGSHIPAVQQRMRGMAANTRKMGAAWAAELASKANFSQNPEHHIEESLRKEVYDAVAASDVESYALTAEMVVDESHKDPDYSVIKCPTLLVAGEYDIISPLERSQSLLELLGSDVQLEIVKTGHQPIVQEPEAVAKFIVDFLDKVKSAT